jgi:hypothetical protein
VFHSVLVRCRPPSSGSILSADAKLILCGEAPTTTERHEGDPKWLISLESLPRPTATFSFDRRGYEELDRRDADRKRDPSESLDRDVQPVLDALVVGESHAQALCDLRLGKIRGGS